MWAFEPVWLLVTAVLGCYSSLTGDSGLALNDSLTSSAFSSIAVFVTKSVCPTLGTYSCTTVQDTIVTGCRFLSQFVRRSSQLSQLKGTILSIGGSKWKCRMSDAHPLSYKVRCQDINLVAFVLRAWLLKLAVPGPDYELDALTVRMCEDKISGIYKGASEHNYFVEPPTLFPTTLSNISDNLITCVSVQTSSPLRLYPLFGTHQDHSWISLYSNAFYLGHIC